MNFIKWIALAAIFTASNLGASPMEFPLIVKASYEKPAQLNLLVRRAAPWLLNSRERTFEIDVNNQFEYDQLLREGFQLEINVEQTIAMRNPAQRLPNQITGIDGFPCYRTLSETLARGAELAQSYPAIAEWVDIGDSQLKTNNASQGYDLRVLRITNRAISGNPGPKPVFFAQGALHAREYTTAETVLRLGEYFLTRYGIDPDVTWMVDHHDIHLLLVANPDGREIAQVSATRMARKNRNPLYCISSATTRGVDLNRNYPFDYAGPGASTVQCNDSFRGPNARSESETQAITNYIQSIFPDQRNELNTPGGDLITPVSLDATGAYFDIHSVVGTVWYSWGNSTTPAPNSTQYASFARKIAFLNGYAPEPGVDGGAIGGASDDFVFGTLGVPSFTIEMGGSSFFESCSSYEINFAQQTLNSLVLAAKVVRAPFRLPSGPDVLNVQVNLEAGGQRITAQASDLRFSSARGTEPTQNIIGAKLYSAPPWAGGAEVAQFSAVDGAFNSASENLTLLLPNALVPEQRQLWYIQAEDAGSPGFTRGPITGVFVGSGFKDGFE